MGAYPIMVDPLFPHELHVGASRLRVFSFRGREAMSKPYRDDLDAAVDEATAKKISLGAGGAADYRPQGISQNHHSTREKGKGSFANSPIIKTFIDTTKLREALGYR